MYAPVKIRGYRSKPRIFLDDLREELEIYIDIK